MEWRFSAVEVNGSVLTDAVALDAVPAMVVAIYLSLRDYLSLGSLKLRF